MKRWFSTFLIVVSVVLLVYGLAAAQPVRRGFGFGGAMAMGFFPDMTGINTFLSENGLPDMDSYLVGAGGSGRGGVIGGLSFGGAGWGLMNFSESEGRSAELIVAGGGFDLGAVLGGDSGSVLSIGVVLGGGSNLLTLTEGSDDQESVCPSGIVPAPTSRELVHVQGFVQPYVSMAAQLLPWMGFELRIGYLFPAIGFDFGDLLGIPAPSLELSGPTVSFGISFGGIGSGSAETDRASAREARDERQREREVVTSTSQGSIPVESGDTLVLENNVGDVFITGIAASQTASERVVMWEAVRTAQVRKMNDLQVTIDRTDWGPTLKTEGLGQVDYVIRVPVGTDLEIRNAAGVVHLEAFEGRTVLIENGVGELMVEDTRAAALILSGGVGTIALRDVDAETLIATLGVGEITLGLPVDVSARILAKAGIGDVTIDRFPGMTGGFSGFLGKSGAVTLGMGSRMIELNVRLGEISIDLDLP